MKLLVDPAIFDYGRCGMTRYWQAILAGLQERQCSIQTPVVSSGCDFQTRLTKITAPLRLIPRAPLILGEFARHWFRRAVRGQGYDLVLITDPAFRHRWLDENPNAPFAMVVHDLMTCVIAPDGLYDAAGPALVNLLYLARRASVVICISEETRRTLLAMVPLDPSRIAVVRTGNLLAESKPTPAQVALPKRFVLFVGERSGRKGFFSFIDAMAALSNRHPGVSIVCTGTLSKAELDHLEHLGVSNRVFPISANDSVLVTMYKRAACLVYPSLYEGFGLPVIEAMHYGCPVLTTNRGALPEIAGSAAYIIDPEVPGSLQAGIDVMLSDPAFADDYRERGLKHAQQYAASVMLDAFHGALKQATRTVPIPVQV